MEILPGGAPDWARIRVRGIEGWVSRRYLADDLRDRRTRFRGAVRARTDPHHPPVPGPRRPTDGLARARSALKQRGDWRVGSPEHVLPAGENRPETYGGVRYFFEGDSVLARAVCTEVQAEMARHGYSVAMPLWPMVTRQRLGLFNARPGLIEVWISPLPPPASGGGPVQPGQCGR